MFWRTRATDNLCSLGWLFMWAELGEVTAGRIRRCGRREGCRTGKIRRCGREGGCLAGKIRRWQGGRLSSRNNPEVWQEGGMSHRKNPEVWQEGNADSDIPPVFSGTPASAPAIPPVFSGTPASAPATPPKNSGSVGVELPHLPIFPAQRSPPLPHCRLFWPYHALETSGEQKTTQQAKVALLCTFQLGIYPRKRMAQAAMLRGCNT